MLVINYSDYVQHQPTTNSSCIASYPWELASRIGFFDTSQDRQLTNSLRKDAAFNNVNISELDGQKKSEMEEKQRKKDAQRQKLHKKTNLPEVLMQINKMNDPMAVQRRTKLILPAPQVSDRELEEIVKMGNAGTEASGTDATRALLSSYGATPTPASTARTPLGGMLI